MSYVIHDRGLNLADARAGASVVSVSDEFFAPCARMLNPEPPVFIEGKYDEHGKWMDGWESRRKRVAGYDHCVIRLAVPGVIKKIDIDTSHFIGNFPPQASLEACYCMGTDPDDNADWVSLLTMVDLSKDAHHLCDVNDSHVYSHVRLNIFPDGGVARLKVYGEPRPIRDSSDTAGMIDLASLIWGGQAIACSDECFGSSMAKLNYPGRGVNMGDGWETARRRVPGNDWVIFQLARPSLIDNVVLDTAHYKGNYPDAVMLQATSLDSRSVHQVVNQSLFWKSILAEQKLQADTINTFDIDTQSRFPVTHIKVNIIPDGGVSRIRLHGAYCE